MSYLEGNVLFNDGLNTFYLLLYGVRGMIKYRYHHRIAERDHLYAQSHGQDITYHGIC